MNEEFQRRQQQLAKNAWRTYEGIAELAASLIGFSYFFFPLTNLSSKSAD